MYIEQVNSPQDIKQFSAEQLRQLAGEIRNALLTKLSAHGGHVGPNLGMVEATIALHYVFNSPTDKMVYDVSHQSYTHKMLTGRKGAFLNPEDYDVVSGYTNPRESGHDFFTIGHTSTSVSLACGLAKARDLKGGHENIIAVIGDGSLSGGEAYEGLSNAGEMGTNLIIVVNDNEMSIYNPQIQISAESETKRSIFREKDKTKRSKKESAQHSKSRNKSFVMTSVSAL